MKNISILIALTFLAVSCNTQSFTGLSDLSRKIERKQDLISGQFTGFHATNNNPVPVHQYSPPRYPNAPTQTNYGGVNSFTFARPAKAPVYQQPDNDIIFPNQYQPGGLITGHLSDDSQFGPYKRQKHPKKPPANFNPPSGIVTNNFYNIPRNIPRKKLLTSTTTMQPTTTIPTTASPAFLKCLRNCQTTNEYNPVCGSDNINYHNAQKLICAQRCGKKDVQQNRLGPCTSAY